MSLMLSVYMYCIIILSCVFRRLRCPWGLISIRHSEVILHISYGLSTPVICGCGLLRKKLVSVVPHWVPIFLGTKVVVRGTQCIRYLSEIGRRKCLLCSMWTSSKKNVWQDHKICCWASLVIQTSVFMCQNAFLLCEVLHDSHVSFYLC